MKFPCFISALFCTAATLCAQSFPSDSQMATKAGSLQKFVLAALTNPEEAAPGGYKISNGKSEAFTGEMPPDHKEAILLSGEAGSPEGKGDFNVATKLEGNTKYVGAWFYIGPEANVKRLGIQFHEASGEYVAAFWPADFQGWKWLDTDVTDTTIMVQPHPQDQGNSILDEQTDRVSIVWWSSGPGQTSLGVTDLTTAAD